MIVLVTGANSFIASHLIPFLVSRGASAVGTYRRENSRLDHLRRSSGISLIQLDISEASMLARLPRKVDAVVHVAAASNGTLAGAGGLVASNVIGTQNVVDYAIEAQAKTFIYMSSVSIYGTVSTAVLEEGCDITNPCDYGITKYLGERILLNADGLNRVALRLPGVLGVGAHRAWLPSLVEGILRGERDVSVYSPRAPFNNAVHVSELAEFVWLLLNSGFCGSSVMNLGADGEMTIGAILDLIRETLGGNLNVAVLPEQKKPFIISSMQAKRAGYRPGSIQEIIKRFLVETTASSMASAS